MLPFKSMTIIWPELLFCYSHPWIHESKFTSLRKRISKKGPWGHESCWTWALGLLQFAPGNGQQGHHTRGGDLQWSEREVREPLSAFVCGTDFSCGTTEDFYCTLTKHTKHVPPQIATIYSETWWSTWWTGRNQLFGGIQFQSNPFSSDKWPAVDGRFPGNFDEDWPRCSWDHFSVCAKDGVLMVGHNWIKGNMTKLIGISGFVALLGSFASFIDRPIAELPFFWGLRVEIWSWLGYVGVKWGSRAES